MQLDPGKYVQLYNVPETSTWIGNYYKTNTRTDKLRLVGTVTFTASAPSAPTTTAANASPATTTTPSR